jgi:hypothetical protein
MKTYQTWSKTKPVEIIEAETGFAARKVFAAKHGLPVHECMARLICEHERVTDASGLVDECSRCHKVRA